MANVDVVVLAAVEKGRKGRESWFLKKFRLFNQFPKLHSTGKLCLLGIYPSLTSLTMEAKGPQLINFLNY